VNDLQADDVDDGEEEEDTALGHANDPEGSTLAARVSLIEVMQANRTYLTTKFQSH
jgi:hypothetical protein